MARMEGPPGWFDHVDVANVVSPYLPDVRLAVILCVPCLDGSLDGPAAVLDHQSRALEIG